MLRAGKAVQQPPSVSTEQIGKAASGLGSSAIYESREISQLARILKRLISPRHIHGPNRRLPEYPLLRRSDSQRQPGFSSIRQRDHGLSAYGEINRGIGRIARLLATIIRLPAYGAARADHAGKPRIERLAAQRGIEIVHIDPASGRDDLGFPFLAIAGRRHARNEHDTCRESDHTGREFLRLNMFLDAQRTGSYP